jgi:hypothetical protein
MDTANSSVAQVLRDHVTLEVESIDRMYLNVYVPRLQRELGIVSFIKYHLGQPVPSTVVVAKTSKEFVKAIRRYTELNGVPLVRFERGQRKEDVAREHLRRFAGEEGVLFVGSAQEKAPIFRTERRHRPDTGEPYPWIVRSTGMVNHYYFYCLDKDFGPFFLKFCSYFPYNAKLCINGHEYAKCQLDQRGIAYESLDNGFLSCEDPERLQRICDGLSAARIQRLLRKWIHRLPHPYTQHDRQEGYDYDLSILQAEFALTQVFDRPLTGRIFFEQVLHENLDLGRPDHIQLIFNRRVTRRTPGRFRTRVITDGVIPSLYVDYKSSKVHQYHKEGRALRTETTINNTYDFAIGRRLHNLPELRQVGFQANRRLLDVQKTSHDCTIGEDVFQQLQQPCIAGGQRVSALRFGDLRIQMLFQALVIFRLSIAGFTNRDLRELLAPLLGLDLSQLTPGMMTYDLRRLRLRGIIARIPGRNRYLVTDHGLRIALFYSRTYARVLRVGLAHTFDNATPSPIRRAYVRLESLINDHCAQAKLAA